MPDHRPMTDVNRLLEAAHRGDRQAAAELLPLVYDELRKLAAARLAREPDGHTLNSTALVHEAYVRLVGLADEKRWQTRGHFFAAAAEAMRRILIDHARKKQAAKHGGQAKREGLDADKLPAPQPDDDLLALDEALTKLAEKDPVKADLVKLRYFAGLTADQAAAALGISASTADRYWTYARAWLRRAMTADPG
jgi:RNA polymerase sigma factor (TIGR02999 family)